MTLEQLIELYIMRKNNQCYEYLDYLRECNHILPASDYQCSDGLAPPLSSIADQAPIYYTLVQPKFASEKNPVPLIIITPDLCQTVSRTYREPEVIYYVTQGFAVACPSYRGGYRPVKNPDDKSVLTQSIIDELKAWEEKAKGKYHIFGPQDVHALVLHLRNMPTIRQDKTFLCGTGHGALINSHLLAQVKAGKFENVYSGAQLTSGSDYPLAKDLPNNLPVLISHSVQDKKAPFLATQSFMKSMLLIQKRAQEQEEKKHNQVQIFVSKSGDDHLLDRGLKIENTQTEAYQELYRYLAISTRFIHEVTDTSEFKAEPPMEQLKRLYANDSDLAELTERLKKLAPSQYRDLDVEGLVELYILQKDYHKKVDSPSNFVSKFLSILAHHRVSSSDELAPPLASVMPAQPQIPFVLYKPASATADQPRPLIIHTHGGPEVYYNLNNPHAEIAYYLAQGFVVVCPNYRGSTPYVSPNADITLSELEKWQSKAESKYHLLGPEDIHAVAMHMRKMPYVRQDKIFLRGMSFGSFINAHLLAQVKTGKFENIYSGAQLTSGLDYPVPEDMPTNIPIMIAHAINDPITSFQEAQLFMRKMLLVQHLAMEKGQTRNYIQTFVSEVGDHHLIDTDLKLEAKDSSSYLELRRFLEISARFIHDITDTGEFKAEAPLDQLNRLEAKDRVMILAQSYAQTMSLNDQINFSSAFETKAEVRDVDDEEKHILVKRTAVLSPTQAHLKLVLGEGYSGILKQDLELFLGQHFKPRKWNQVEEIWEELGQDMLQDTPFMNQIMAMLEHEIAFLAEHPDYMVIYHAGEQAALQLYSFITIWKNMLRGDFRCSHEVLNEMRVFDFMTQSFDDIQVFLYKMRQQKGTVKDSSLNFNHLPGFPDRALACNPALTSNYHTTASCSLVWYFTADRYGARLEVPFINEIKTLLRSLGIFTEERLKRYVRHFDRDQQALLYQGKHQSVMQQIYLPYTMANEKAYLCQIWGEEFTQTQLPFDLSQPSSLQAFRQDPFVFEGLLKTHKKTFINFGNVPDFGENNFKYSTLIQMRYLHRQHPQVPIKTYIRQHSLFKPFWQSLENLAREDFADFVVIGGAIPCSLMNGAENAHLRLRTQLKLSSQSIFSENVLHIIFLQQKELYSGLVENPRKEIYGDILKLSKEDKVKLQEQLGDLRFKGPHRMRLFQLCRYLKGYTYYDLLMEAAQATILNKANHPPRAKQYLQENYELLVSYIERFSTSISVSEEYLSGNAYHDLKQIINDSVSKHQYTDHQFFQADPNHPAIDNILFGLELRLAINSFLDYASMAKERGYGHDVSTRLKMSY